MIVELAGEEFHFDKSLSLRMEVTAGVAAEVLDLIVDAFGEVGRAQVGVSGGWIFDKGQVIGGALFQMFNPGFVVRPEPIEHGAEPGLSAFKAAGRLDVAPSFFEGGVVLQAQMALGVTEQMDSAELVVGVWKQASDHGRQTAEVVSHQQ